MDKLDKSLVCGILIGIGLFFVLISAYIHFQDENSEFIVISKSDMEKAFEEFNRSTLELPRSSGYIDMNNIIRYSLERKDENNNEMWLVGITGRNLTYSPALGKSMLPTIREGSYILIEQNFSKSDIKIGDIVIFKDDKKQANIDHRVVWINETYFISRGDNNFLNDKIQPVSNINGLVVGVLY